MPSKKKNQLHYICLYDQLIESNGSAVVPLTIFADNLIYMHMYADEIYTYIILFIQLFNLLSLILYFKKCSKHIKRYKIYSCIYRQKELHMLTFG